MSQSTLEQFRAKRATWRSHLEDDPMHAITTALAQLGWNEVRFRTLSFLAVEQGSEALKNELLAEALVEGHVALQVLGIRRLCDSRHDVISLRRVLDDVRNNIHLLTRENYLNADSLPYDYNAFEMKTRPERISTKAVWVSGDGSRSRFAHEHFDRLCGTQPDQRRPDDRVPARLIETVQRWLDECEASGVVDWSHKFLAHAADKTSREKIEEYNLSNDKIYRAIKALYRTAEGLSQILYIGSLEHRTIPVAQYEKFDFLHLPVSGIRHLAGC